MKRAFLSGVFAFVLLAVSPAAEKSFSPVDYVNPFIGTTNFGTTNPGAVCPNGMMSVVPFNVMGSADNKYDKDARWWSTPMSITTASLPGIRMSISVEWDVPNLVRCC